MSKTLGQRLDDFNIEVGTAMTIDWQQVRIQVSTPILCELSGYMFSAGYSEKQVAEQALKLADALIAELKKGGEDDSNMHNN